MPQFFATGPVYLRDLLPFSPPAANVTVSYVHQDRERKEKERLKKQQELDDNMTEIANHIYGDILTENPSVAHSAWGPHRVIPDRWKGMTPSQLEDIRKAQERQRLENEVSCNSRCSCS